MTTAAVPVVNQSFPYAYGGSPSWGGQTRVTVQAGLFRDSTNTIDMNIGNWGTSNSNTTIDATTNGVNGLDTGSLANNTWYGVFVIGSSLNLAPTACLLSTATGSTSNPPTLPENYDAFRRIGWVLTDGSAHFLIFYQSGNYGHRTYQWNSPISVLSGGTATTFTAVDLSSAMPIQTTTVWLNIAYTPSSASNTASIRPTGTNPTAANSPIYIKASAAAQERSVTTRIIPLVAGGIPEIDYVVTSGDSLNISVAGFDDIY